MCHQTLHKQSSVSKMTLLRRFCDDSEQTISIIFYSLYTTDIYLICFFEEHVLVRQSGSETEPTKMILILYDPKFVVAVWLNP